MPEEKEYSAVSTGGEETMGGPGGGWWRRMDRKKLILIGVVITILVVLVIAGITVLSLCLPIKDKCRCNCKPYNQTGEASITNIGDLDNPIYKPNFGNGNDKNPDYITEKCKEKGKKGKANKC